MPYRHARAAVQVRLTARTVEVFAAGERIAAHMRGSGNGRHTTINDQMPSSHRSYADWMIERIFAWAAKLSEAIGLRRDEVDLAVARLWVRRLKNGLSVEQPIAGDEVRAIRRYLAMRNDHLPWLFVSERGAQLTRQAVNYLLAQASARAGLPSVNPHMLRHSCGFALANRAYDLRLIQDHLGHRDPKHTVRYTRTAARRFEGLWR